jgi:hypothetical protein
MIVSIFNCFIHIGFYLFVIIAVVNFWWDADWEDSASRVYAAGVIAGLFYLMIIM